MVSPTLVKRTVATFTGGFKREHGAFKYGDFASRNRGSHYGFLEEGVVFSRPQPGRSRSAGVGSTIIRWSVLLPRRRGMGKYTTQEIDERFALLDQYERRCIIHFLRETGAGHARFGDVVSHVQKQDPTPEEVDQLAGVLHHHLPKLATINLLEFDSRSGMVRYHGDELVEALLDVTPETHIPGP
jgi:hypothetical protein